MNPLYLPLIAIGCIYALWLFYLAVMNLIRARDAGTLSRPAYILGLPILLIGLAIDFLTNMILVTILFLELPREPLVTARLSRHINESTGWRKHLAQWFCKNLLDAFDPSGCHCK
jgi:hypothetical protein